MWSQQATPMQQVRTVLTRDMDEPTHLQEHQIEHTETGIVVEKEATLKNTKVVESHDEGTEEEMTIEVDSSSSPTDSEEEEESKVSCLWGPSDAKEKGMDSVNTIDSPILFNANSQATIFEEKPEKSITEDIIQETLKNSLEESSTQERKNEKDGAINVLLNLDETHKVPLLSNEKPLAQDKELSPRKIYFGQRHKRHTEMNEMEYASSCTANVNDFENSETIIEMPEYEKKTEQKNTFAIVNRKPDFTDSKSTDTVIEIPGYEENLKENRNQKLKHEVKISRPSGMLPLVGMLGIGSLLYILASNQST